VQGPTDLSKLQGKSSSSFNSLPAGSGLYKYRGTTTWYQVKSRAQKADGQKADINNPIKQKAEMQKTDMSKSRQSKS
jgi:hypothetical protein